jgi:hypothetical protein
MSNSLYQTITLALATISIEFGAIVSVFIVYASGEIAAAYREQAVDEEELVNPLIVARFAMLQTAAGVSTLILLTTPVIAIVGLLFARQLTSYTSVILYYVMIGEISLFSFAVWLIISVVLIYLVRELRIHALLLGAYRPRRMRQ